MCDFHKVYFPINVFIFDQITKKMKIPTQGYSAPVL